MQVTVYHQDRDSSFVNVATIDCGDRKGTCALDYAFHRTQNIEGSWSREAIITVRGEEHMNSDWHKDIKVNAKLPVHNGQTFGLRSSMVGDRFYCEEGSFEVAPLGFDRIEVEEDVPAEVEVESDELNQTGGWSDDTLAMMGKSIIKQAKAKTSNKARVAAIIESYGDDVFFTLVNHRAQIIERIVNELNVTKANAGVYVYNFKKARGV